MKTKRIISLVVAALMLMSMTSLSAFAAEKTPFTDVTDVYKFNDAINYVYENKIMVGTTETTFSPNQSLTRAMIVTMLWRLEGQPVVNYAISFTDVDMGDYYGEAVRWAQAEKVVNGVSDTEFAPNQNVSREQLAAMVFRYAKEKGVDVNKATEDTNTLSFDDIADISEYASSAVHFCLATGALVSRDQKNIDPQKDATRGEAANALYAVSKLEKENSSDNNGENPQIPNPVVPADEKEIIEKLGFEFGIPSDATDVKFSIISDEIAQMTFKFNNLDFTARMKAAGKFDDISGLYYSWKDTEDETVSGHEAQIMLTTEEDTSIEVCLWYDAVPGIMYSLSTESTDLNGIDIKAVAEQVYKPMQGDAE